jgi:hypothetical protein
MAVICKGLDNGTFLTQPVHLGDMSVGGIAEALGVTQSIDDYEDNILGLVAICVDSRYKKKCCGQEEPTEASRSATPNVHIALAVVFHHHYSMSFRDD